MAWIRKNMERIGKMWNSFQHILDLNTLVTLHFLDLKYISDKMKILLTK